MPSLSPPIVDAHVHVFPPRVLNSIYRWFNEKAWPIKYPLQAAETLQHLFAGGVSRAVGLHYAHAPGLAAALNRFIFEVSQNEPRLIPCATVLPGEPGARAILDEALGPLGLRGIKLHCHVQCMAPDDARLDEVYDAAAAHDVPVIIHAGDAPASPHYHCDVYELCRPELLERALVRHPATTFIVPHLGAERMEEISALLDRFPRLHLDTTMTLGRFFPTNDEHRVTDGARAEEYFQRAMRIVRRWPERILYGTDFPFLPYDWDRELRGIQSAGLDASSLSALLSGNAARLFKITDL